MGYLIGEIIVCLLLAALIGAIIGWMLRGVRARSRAGVLTTELEGAQAKLLGAEENIASLQNDCGRLQTELDQRSAELQNRGEEIEALKRTVAERDERIGSLVQDLRELRGRTDVQIEALTAERARLSPLQGLFDQARADSERLEGELRTLAASKAEELARLQAESRPPQGVARRAEGARHDHRTPREPAADPGPAQGR